MADTTFFWHDYETFGTLPRRDWPAQFAGLRTDAELNEIGAPVMLFCQPPIDRLPQPEACLLTGITPQQCQAQGLPEHEFATQVLAALGAPGTVGVGYNSIRFDDEVTRHLFWRNLIEPYGREWQNGCGRWDLLDTVRCAWALRPDGLAWPSHEDGKASFKLTDLTAANGLVHEAAHDALSDVRATLALARLLRQAQPRLFDFCLRLRRKDAVWQEIGVGQPFLHISGRYAVEHGCTALVWPLAPHPTNKNELIVWDLAYDPAELLALNADAVRARLFVRSQDLPEGQMRLPIKSIHVNKSPIVIGKQATLSPVMAERWGLDRAVWARNATSAQAHAAALHGLRDTLWPAVFSRPGDGAPADVDEDLYGGFVGHEDRRTLDRLRALSPAQLAAKRPAFSDPRLAELLLRYRARNFPDTLNADDQAHWLQHRQARLHGGALGMPSVAQYFDQLDALNENADARSQDILEALYDWAQEIAPEPD